MPCLMAKPIVNGIEKELAGRAPVVRLNMLTAPGRDLARRFDVSSLPTLLVLDGAGEVIHRQAGVLDRKAVLASLSTR